MLSALLLLTTVSGPPAALPARAPAVQDDPAIRIWLSDDGRYQRGDRAQVQVKTQDDGYLLVLQVDPDGHLRVLFPLDPNDDAFVRGGKKYEITGRGDRESFMVDQRSGHGTVYAAVSRDPFRFDGYVTGDHWDYAALDDVHVSDKPEADLNEFVQRLARSDFDYDVLGYDVYENVVYGSGTTVYNYGPMIYSDGYDGFGCYSYWGCGGSSIFIGINLGHHRRFYDPFFYGPVYYDPFFYRPFYYPVYYYPYPVYYYPRSRYPFYHYPYYRPGYRYPVYSTPWRQRTAPVVATSFWRSREVPTRTPTSGTLASAYTSRFLRDRPATAPAARPARGSFTPGSGSLPNRDRLAAAPRRDLNGGARTANGSNPIVLSNSPERAPVGRRAVDRPDSRVTQPQRANAVDRGNSRAAVGSRGAGAERRPAADEPRKAPVRTPEARPAAPQIRDRSPENEPRVLNGDDRSGYEGVRVISPRGPAARRADDDRPASHPDVQRGSMSSPPARVERDNDDDGMRAAPRSSPPPARIEPRQPESRSEPRAMPAPRGGNDGSPRGGGNDGGRGGQGGGGAAPQRGGGHGPAGGGGFGVGRRR